MPRHLLALALGVCAGVAVMVVAARGIALSRMLYLLAGLIFAGNLFAALAFDYWSMLAARFIAGLPHGAYFGVSAIVATSLAAPGQASRDVCLMVTGMTIANLVGVPLGSFLAWSLSWRATFAVVACAALLLILALRLWMPHVPALPNKGFRAQFRFLGHLTPWLVLGAIGLGNGGFFACYSYVNPIMETVASVPSSLMSAVIALAGFDMNALIWPSPEQYQEAIRKVDFSFAADNFYRDETHHDMDIVLPAALNFERYAPFGVHGRKVSVRRPVKPQGEAWEDWKIACTIGAAVCDPETFFHGDPVKACDSILKDWGVTYEKQQGVLPNLQTVEFFPPQTTGKHEKALLRFDGKPGFRTPSGKIELVASLQAKHGFPGLPVYVEPPKPTAEYPFKLLNGTRRPYITHSKTRSDQPYLLELEPESTINMHPKDAEKLGIKEGDGVWLVSPYCDHKVRAKVRVTILCQPGLIDAQYGWRGDQETQPLIPRKNWDPISGYPCCNDVCIRVEKA